MQEQFTIQTLRKQGKTNAEIARILKIHRNTVRNVLKRETIIEKQTRVKPSRFDRYKEQIKDWLDNNVTNLRILELLTESYGVSQTYTTLCKYIQKHFPKPIEAFGVQNTAPGEEAELDFGYLGMLPGKDGKRVKTWGLAVILSYSRVGYYAICYDQKLDTLCSELKQAFTYFGGVPEKLKVDNMKTAIQKNQRYELEFNRDFLEFARHYSVVIVPCTPYSPEQKGKVESGIKYMQQNFVNGRDFTDDRDIARKLKDWMTNYANQRTHGTTRKVPWAELLKTERAQLQALPTEEFCLFQREVRKVAPNCHIHFDNVYYSVPSLLVGREVTVRYNDHLIRVIDQGEQVALHVRSFQKGSYVTVRAHLPEYKIYSETERQAKVEAQMRAIGESAHEYFRVLLATKASYWFRSTRVILGLSKQYGAEAVNLSLKRALYYKATDVLTIKHILEKKLYEASLEPILPKEETTDNSLCRNLSYYSLS